MSTITIANGVQVKSGDTVYDSSDPRKSLIAERSVSMSAMVLFADGLLSRSETVYATRNEAVRAAIAQQGRIAAMHLRFAAECNARIAELEALRDGEAK